MSLYPPILPLRAYRYTPFKDEPPSKQYIDFICIRWINDSEYVLMVLNDKLDFDEDVDVLEGQYGDIEVKEWHVDLKEIEVKICDVKFAKLMGL